MIDLTLNSAGLQSALSDLRSQGQNLKPLLHELAGIASDATEDAFANEADPVTGEPWAELSAGYLSMHPERSGGQILQSSGQLAQSVQQVVTANTAMVGSNKIYAALQHFGGTPDMPVGTRDVPGRAYFGLSPADEGEMLAAVSRFLSV
jgi:phage virion morphogenesis protein